MFLAAILTGTGPAPAVAAGGGGEFRLAQGSFFGNDAPDAAAAPDPLAALPQDHICAGLGAGECAALAAALADRVQALTDRAAALEAEAGAPGDLPEGHVCEGLDAPDCASRAGELALAVTVATARAERLAAEAEAGAERSATLAAVAAALAAEAEAEAEALRDELAAATARAGEAEAEAAAAALRAGEVELRAAAATVRAEQAETEAAALAADLDAARSLADLPEAHPCQGLSAEECAALAGTLAARIDELEPLARYRRLFLDANTEIDRLSAALESCSATPDCTADPGLIEAKAALQDATARLAETEAARADAAVQVAALEAALAEAESELAATTGQVEGLRAAMTALERENARLAEELRTQRDLPRIQAALAELPCAPGGTALEPGGAVPVIARSTEEAARIGRMLEGLGGGVRFEIGLAATIPGAGCPSVVTPVWAAVRWEGEPPEVVGSIVGSADAGSRIALIPDAALCGELAVELGGAAARFWVRRSGQLALCDVAEGAIDDTRGVRGAAAVLLLPLETVATVGGG